ncbi:LETM1 domain-containing protein 1 isoform X2 [Hippocampus comes]|uniref:LETM1 domain containing 1 n=1 Tax=Hippocampus comes TaxID=109280 RepID=A0A3Q3DVI7_HIPCM|nr:PREDICTED: LETM1 domain-containing protein 1 isoform X1 [Hippocampus comes]XP_019720664.1 PREDICTED: LETM1 domain-containing protein 1 isoform X2 [Hippocampus comes]
MALSCSRLTNNLSLIRLWSVRTNQIANGLYGQCVCHQSRHYSSSEVRRGIGRYVTSRLQWVNSKYEGFLKRRFPRFYLLYHTFVEGFKLLFRDAKDVSRIKTKMLSDGVKFQDLSYREMEKLRQFRRDMLKGIPLVLISIPPFANYLVFFLMYFFPRQVLIPHFWTPKQQVEFRQLYHSIRARQHRPVLLGLQHAGGQVKDSQLRSRLDSLCSQVQNGANPKVSEVLAVRSLFSGTPLGMSKLSVGQMRNISPLLFLTPRLPGFLIGRRLTSHALELLQLDRALSKLGPHQLSDSEVRQACYVRGLNSDRLAINQCRVWLYQWLQMSSSLKDSDLSLLLHCLVLLSASDPNGIHHP